jgi:hypothetical protein
MQYSARNGVASNIFGSKKVSVGHVWPHVRMPTSFVISIGHVVLLR